MQDGLFFSDIPHHFNFHAPLMKSLRILITLAIIALSQPLSAQTFYESNEMKGIYRDMDKAFRARRYAKADSLASVYVIMADDRHAAHGFNYSQCKFVHAIFLREREQRDEAIAVFDTVISIRTTHFSKGGFSQTGIVYSEKARTYLQLKQVEQAIQNEQKASELFRKDNDKENYTTSQINLGNYYRQRDNAGDGELSYQCFLEASKNAVKGTPQWIISHNNILRAMYASGETAKSDKMRAKLEKTAAKTYGEQDPRYLTFLANLAQTLYSVSRYADAVQTADKALVRYRENGSTRNANYGKLLNIIGACYIQLQDMNKAITLLEEAAPILKGTVGETDVTYVNTINLLTKAYYAIGDASHADEYSTQSRHILTSGSQDNSKRSFAFQNLAQAETYANMGDYQQAIDYAQRAMQVFSQRGDSLDMGKTMNALSRYYNRDKQTRKCDSIAQAALRLAERNGFKNIQAEALHLLAVNSEPTVAHDYYVQALSLMEKDNYTHTSEYAKVMSDMANCLYQMGNINQAIEKAREAIQIHTDVMGPQHGDNVTLILNLALYYHFIGQQDSVARYYHQALDLQTQVVRNNFSFLSSNEREKNWNKNNYIFRISPIFISEEREASPQLLTDIYNAQLFTRGILLSSEVDFRKLLNNTSPRVLNEYEKLMSLREQLQQFYSGNDQQAQQAIPRLKKEIETLEHHIVRECKEFGDFTQNLKLNVDSISAHLRPNEAAVEIIDCPIRYDNQADHLYMALILPYGEKHPIVRKLFRQRQLEDLGYRQSIPQLLSEESRQTQEWQNRIYSDARLGQLFWKPIFEAVPSDCHIYFSPTSIFYQWGVEYLAYDGQQRACDLHLISRLSSTKLLAEHRPTPKPLEQMRAVIFGGMDYNLALDEMQMLVNDEEAIDINTRFMALDQAAETELVAQSVESTLRGGSTIVNLPGAEVETQTIYDLLTQHNVAAKLYSFSGMEEHFKRLSGQQTTILHIATHGFSIPPVVNQQTTSIFGVSTLQDADNSLCYSGLFFSGCNNVLKQNPVTLPEGMENGVLTAQEVAEMNLQGLELAVLSACQTGIGEVKEDGVIGLQRGFKKAGAQSLIISLWSIDDEATQLMMTTFYRAMMNGDGRQAAFLKAQNTVRRKYPAPHYWAPFILLDNL